MAVTGKIILNKTIKSAKFGCNILPSGCELNAYIDSPHRIYAQHPDKPGLYILVKACDIVTSTWSNGEEMLNKPKFHEVQLKPIKNDVYHGHKLPAKCNCSVCGRNEWIVKSNAVIECITCGNKTTL